MGSIPITRSNLCPAAVPLISVDAVTVATDPERPRLHDITVRWDESRLGIIGANGSGKSTFVRLLNGLVRPSRGSVQVHGLSVEREVKAVRRRVGFVFQQPDHQVVMPTVAEDVAFGLVNQGLAQGEVDRRVQAVLARFGLSDLANRPCYRLSGGEKQLLALAGVVATSPSVIVFDEPTALLDLKNRNAVRDAIGALSQQVVLVTHDLALLAHFDRVLLFDQGAIAFDGPPAQAIAAYEESVERAG